MAAGARFRDAIRSFVPVWLADRRGLNVGFRVLWTIAAICDVAAQTAIEALQAPWPGAGTPTALDAIGSSRGMRRGQGESDAGYSSRLLTWLDRARQIGSMLSTARAIHEYLGNRPRVRVYNRAGACLEVAETTGAVTRYAAGTTAWDWDSVSHPERASHFWDLWICVYPCQWALSGTFPDGRTFGGSELGLGHAVTREEVDAVKSEIEQHKSAGTHVRAVCWTTDETLFDPTDPGTQPDGTWGAWGGTGSGSRVASGRDTTSTRYWEP